MSSYRDFPKYNVSTSWTVRDEEFSHEKYLFVEKLRENYNELTVIFEEIKQFGSLEKLEQFEENVYEFYQEKVLGKAIELWFDKDRWIVSWMQDLFSKTLRRVAGMYKKYKVWDIALKTYKNIEEMWMAKVNDKKFIIKCEKELSLINQKLLRSS